MSLANLRESANLVVELDNVYDEFKLHWSELSAPDKDGNTHQLLVTRERCYLYIIVAKYADGKPGERERATLIAYDKSDFDED